MINDLDTPGNELWKYVDDSTISESILKDQASTIQSAVDTLSSWASTNKFQLNESKCKELRISFAKTNTELNPIIVNGEGIDSVTSANWNF